MQVCLVSLEYPPDTAHGGIGTQTWNKAQALTRLGHTVHVLSCASGPQDGMSTVQGSGIMVHRMPPPGKEIGRELPIYDEAVFRLGYSWSLLRHLHVLTESHAFDLINFPEYGGEGFAFQLNRTSSNWVPVVVQLHGPLAMLAERIGWPERDSQFYRVVTQMEATSIKLADGLMASSRNIADFATEVYGVERAAIRVVHCGIDATLFQPPPAEQRADHRPTVLYVGTISPAKGIYTVFEAVLLLRTRYPGIRLVVVGGTDARTAQAFRSQARAAGAEDCLDLRGFIGDRAALPTIYHEADVFASPARHEVGVANVYVEAMASGLPVVASTTGGAPEAVTDGESGLLVPPGDVEATVVALERLLGDADLRRRLGAAGRRRVEAYFTIDRYIERVLAAYEETIARSRERLARARLETW
jgi:glycosyltransferase involved in cell wall biosynthesis